MTNETAKSYKVHFTGAPMGDGESEIVSSHRSLTAAVKKVIGLETYAKYYNHVDIRTADGARVAPEEIDDARIAVELG